MFNLYQKTPLNGGSLDLNLCFWIWREVPQVMVTVCDFLAMDLAQRAVVD